MSDMRRPDLGCGSSHTTIEMIETALATAMKRHELLRLVIAGHVHAIARFLQATQTPRRGHWRHNSAFNARKLRLPPPT